LVELMAAQVRFFHTPMVAPYAAWHKRDEEACNLGIFDELPNAGADMQAG